MSDKELPVLFSMQSHHMRIARAALQTIARWKKPVHEMQHLHPDHRDLQIMAAYAIDMIDTAQRALDQTDGDLLSEQDRWSAVLQEMDLLRKESRDVLDGLRVATGEEWLLSVTFHLRDGDVAPYANLYPSGGSASEGYACTGKTALEATKAAIDVARKLKIERAI